MYVLADGDHIFTLNHDLKRLEQMQECDDPQYMLKASTDRMIREDKQQVHDKMIEHIDDILEILRNTKKPEGEEADHIPGAEGHRPGEDPLGDRRCEVYPADLLPVGEDLLVMPEGQ